MVTCCSYTTAETHLNKGTRPRRPSYIYLSKADGTLSMRTCIVNRISFLLVRDLMLKQQQGTSHGSQGLRLDWSHAGAEEAQNLA